jgi:hypothetical protein
MFHQRPGIEYRSLNPTCPEHSGVIVTGSDDDDDGDKNGDSFVNSAAGDACASANACTNNATAGANDCDSGGAHFKNSTVAGKAHSFQPSHHAVSSLPLGSSAVAAAELDSSDNHGRYPRQESDECDKEDEVDEKKMTNIDSQGYKGNENNKGAVEIVILPLPYDIMGARPYCNELSLEFEHRPYFHSPTEVCLVYKSTGISTKRC